MLKTTQKDTIWLVTQPDHARVSGYLAAHWGGVNGFARPGHYPGCVKPEVWRQEVVLAVAEHDNGWWEWEASPPIDPADGLPFGLADVSRMYSGEGLARWRLGVPRLADEHPYAALLMSMHPFWLYAFAFDDLASEADDPFRHALFGARDAAAGLVADREATRKLLKDLQSIQNALRTRLEADPVWAAALDLPHFNPHVKLLQLMDALSLLLSMGREDVRQLADVPRRAWDDRVAITWRPLGNRRIVCEPFPFDTDPLEVHLPVRIVEMSKSAKTDDTQPLTRLHATALRTIAYTIASAAASTSFTTR